MKRVTALLLAVLMAGSILSGCGRDDDHSGKLTLPTGSGSSEPSASGEESTEASVPQTTVPVTTVPASTAAEPTAAPPTETAPPETEPAAPDPMKQLLEELPGIYTVDTGDGESTKVEIREIGGMLMLEFGLCYGRDPYDFWAEEFWPERADAQTIFGQSQCFSVMSNAGGYWDEPRERKISVTEDGIMMTDYQGKNVRFLRDDQAGPMHFSPVMEREFLEEMFRPMENPEPQGRWAFCSGHCLYVLELLPDGSMRYVSKDPGLPLHVYTGAWLCDDETGHVRCSSEKLGYGGMPFMFELEWEKERDGAMAFRDLTGEVPGLGEGAYIFEPVEENWQFWDFHFTSPDQNPEQSFEMLERIEAAVTQIFWEDGEFESGSGGSYSYRIPGLLSQSPDAQRINQAIEARFLALAQRELAAGKDGRKVSCHQISWQCSLWKDVLSLIMWSEGEDGNAEYMVVSFDLAREQELLPEDLLKLKNVTREQAVAAVREAAEAMFRQINTDLLPYQQATMDTLLEKTVSPERIDAGLVLSIGQDGTLSAVAEVGNVNSSRMEQYLLRLPL